MVSQVELSAEGKYMDPAGEGVKSFFLLQLTQITVDKMINQFLIKNNFALDQ